LAGQFEIIRAIAEEERQLQRSANHPSG